MPKILKILKRKRIQGAIVVGVTLILDSLGIQTLEAENAAAVMKIIEVLGALWAIYGVVDAAPGHGGTEA